MCGIFGIIYKRPTKLNKIAFNVLGVDNDSRGGDSCGIFIDGRYEYGVQEQKLYEDFYAQSKVLHNTNKCTIALGHCRKASVGAINESTAQPVIITNPETNKVDFVLIHNGTIYNYKELATKYIPKENITDLTDSQVMAKIFYNAGYDVLKEYNGGGVFVMVDYRKPSPQILLFQGESKLYSTSVSATKERPFYFVQTKDSFVFSSIETFLPIVIPYTKLYVPKTNALLEIKECQLFIVKDYDRSTQTQSKPVTTYTPSYSQYYCDDYYDGYYSYYNKKTTTTTTKALPSTTGNNVVTINNYIYRDSDIRFKIGTQYCNGVYNTDMFGNIKPDTVPETHKFWFWEGFLLKNESCFMYLDKLASFFDGSHREILLYYPEIVSFLSPYPMILPEVTGDHNAYKSSDGITFVPFTGPVHVLFDSYVKYYQTGALVSNREYRHQKEALRAFLLESNKTIDFEVLEQFGIIE